MRKILAVIFTLFTVIFISGCIYHEDMIVVGKGAWESNDFYNNIIKIIIEKGYEIRVDEKPVTTPILVEGLKQKDIHLNVETWSENMPTYNEDIENGHYNEVSINFNDNEQGIFTTKYFAKYMAEQLNKDINDLVLEDLILFKHLLPEDPNDSSKSYIYGGTTEWEVTEFLNKKFSNEESYPELVENFTFEPIRQTPALNQLLITAHENYNQTNSITKDTVWVGYNWKPTAVMGRFDMVLIKDKYETYDPDLGIGNIPANNITIVAIPELENNYPKIYEMLTKFKTSSNDASQALAYLEEDDTRTVFDAAVWWMINNKDVWSSWTSSDATRKINFYLGGLTKTTQHTNKAVSLLKVIK